MSIQKVITNKTTDVIFNAIERHSKNKNLAISDVQLSLGIKIVEGTDNQAENSYTICEKYVPVESMNYKKVLGKPDFMNTQQLAEPIILSGLVKYAQELGSNPLEMKALCEGRYVKNAKGKDERVVIIHLYNGANYFKKITIAEFLKIELPNIEGEEQNEEKK